MSRKWYENSVVRIMSGGFAVLLIILIVLLALRGAEAEALPVPGPTPTVVLPTATAKAQPTETPAFPTSTPLPTAVPTATAVPTSVPTATSEPTATGTLTPTSTPTPIVRSYLFPLFFLEQGQSETLTIPLEPAGTAVFEFETNGPPIELQVFYQGELGFSQRCKDFRDSTKPFNSHVFLPVEVSLENPGPEFTFTNSCGVSSVQVSAGYTITFQP